METGGEILYPWVSRMLMLGLYVTGEIPFSAVYIHGYVMAEDGSKMSKSVGNVINPIGVIDEYGADALRIGIIMGRAPAVNRGYDTRKVADGRNFCNKLWNIARYIEDSVSTADISTTATPARSVDYWILDRLQQIVETVSNQLDNYAFSEAFDTLYHFVWDDFADWYVEASKLHRNDSVLTYTLESILRLVHPFAPFVSETIWQALDWHSGSVLAADHWPSVTGDFSAAAAEFVASKNFVTEIRTIKSTLNITDKLIAHYLGDISAEASELLCHLAQLSALESGNTGFRLLASTADTTLRLALSPKELERYAAVIAKQEVTERRTIAQLEARLANDDYVSKHLMHLIADTKLQLSAAQGRLQLITENADRFNL